MVRAIQWDLVYPDPKHPKPSINQTPQSGACDSSYFTILASKRKRVGLTLKEKLEIVKLVDRGSSYKSVAAHFNIGKSTVSDVYKACGRVEQFMAELDDCHSKIAKKRCIV